MDGLEDNDERESGETGKDEIHKEALERFKLGMDAWAKNRESYSNDVRFARLAEQWPDDIMSKRNRKKRPCLTFNRMPSFIRQVVNDARQNKPAIKVSPFDSKADPKTAEIIQGLIRNIEASSNADIAYDTAVDNACSGGYGFFRIDVAPSVGDVFENDIVFERIVNPLMVIPDHNSTAADSSDWTYCFVCDTYSDDEFETRWPKAQKIDFDLDSGWKIGEDIVVAEYWHREQVDKEVYLMQTGDVIDAENVGAFLMRGIQPIDSKTIKDWKVTQHIMNGAEVIESNEWKGKYIPIVPVFGEEVYVDGERYLRSMIADAKDSQRSYNYWRTSAIEKVALDVKAPFIGPRGAFKSDPNWLTASTDNHAYLEYDGGIPPQRAVTGGVPAGDLQMSAMANDDMKAIIGMYDASLGKRSNETSGVAIRARAAESDNSNFHFIDNLARAIKHGGKIIVDLIPHVYTGPRILRTLGEDGSTQPVQVNQPFQTPEGYTAIYDITTGKYDVSVSVGPSYATKRQEAAVQMQEIIRAYPPLMQIGGDLLVKNLDWPGADELSKRMAAANPLANGQGPQGNPQQGQQMAQMQQQFQAQMQQAQQKMGELTKKLVELTQQNQMLQLQLKDKSAQNMIDQQANQIEQFNAETHRSKVVLEAQKQRAEQMQGIGYNPMMMNNGSM